jgi:16S rRNA (adenine1518-N6/adenine1519-N6)-dimethyltransferase
VKSAAGADHIAKKRFGQNFLHDPGIIRRIVDLIRPIPGECLIEIGPGQGALTAPLIAAAGRITAVELDQDLLPRLRAQFAPEALDLIAQDVLTVDFSALAQAAGQPLRIVGNLPYNISTPLLFHLMPLADQVRDQTFMLQKEVVDRMVAAPGSKVYGRLSVMLQARYTMERLLRVPAGAFVPAPKVESAIVVMRPLQAAARTVVDDRVFSQLVTQAFSARRKMLRNTLAPYGARLDLRAVGLLPTQRPEEVSVAQYQALAAQISSVTPFN